MLKEIIPLTAATIGTEEQKTVDARALHEFLGVKSRFNDWIANRIKKYDLSEGVDFVSLTKNLVNGGTQKEVFLSLSTAKELAMVENNERGKQARLYFIECEKIAKQTTAPALPNYAEALRQLADELEQNAVLQKQIEADAPKVSAYNNLVDDKGLYTATAVAKIFNMGRNELFTWAANNHVIYKQGKTWLPYATWINKRWAALKVTEGNNKTTGEAFSSQRLRFTASGIFQMHKSMKAQNIKVPEQLDLEI